MTDARLLHQPGKQMAVYTQAGSFTATYCRACRRIWPCPAILAASNPKRQPMEPHEFEGSGRRCIRDGCWRGRAAKCHTSNSQPDQGPAEPHQQATNCGYADFNTCRAQNCGGFASTLSEPPFCADCLALLPRLVRERLCAEWGRMVMTTVQEPELRERRFTLPAARRRTSHEFYTEDTGETITREVIDVDGLITMRRRLEIQAAWTIRQIRRAEVSK